MMYGNFTERELDAFWIGVESEQTRIIKLLEQEITTCQRTIKGLRCEPCLGTKDAIGVIKGLYK